MASNKENHIKFELPKMAGEMLYGKTDALFSSEQYRKFSTFFGFMQGRSTDWLPALREAGVVPGGTEDLPTRIAKGYQKEAADFGKRLYDLIRVAADGHEGAACDFCGTGIYELNQDTAFSKLANLDKLPQTGDQDLFWRDEYVLNCGSCGGHSVVDVSEVTKKINVDLGWMKTSAPNAKLRELNFREIIELTLQPFRHGTRVLADQMKHKLED